jgi:hypothetical protein
MKLSERKQGGEFTPHPETDGTVKAVIVDLTPLKTRTTKFGEREEFRLVYETEVTNDDGRRFCVWSRGYTPSLNEKASFRKDLKKIMGRDLTALELQEFDTEGLIGTPVSLIIQHEKIETGAVYATISFVGPHKSGDPIAASGAYKRVKDRDAQPAATGEQAGYKKAPAAKEDEGRVDWQKVKVHVGAHSGVDLGDLAEDAVKALVEKWLPVGVAMPKPLKADRQLIAALQEVKEYIDSEPPAPVADY